jgi:hypothetical protein
LAALTGPASTAQSTLPITGDGHQLTVRVNTNHSSEHGGWGIGQVVAGGTGHLVPTAISGLLVDDAIDQTLSGEWPIDLPEGHQLANSTERIRL